ncbi:MAG: DUF6448 family protein [Lentisphaeria bacterium]|jgi:hypothetical protein
MQTIPRDLEFLDARSAGQPRLRLELLRKLTGVTREMLGRLAAGLAAAQWRLRPLKIGAGLAAGQTGIKVCESQKAGLANRAAAEYNAARRWHRSLVRWKKNQTNGRGAPMNAPKLIPSLLLLATLAGTLPQRAAAHCDTMNGPVVQAAQQALAKGDVTPILIWVQPADEPAVALADQALAAKRHAGEGVAAGQHGHEHKHGHEE